MEETTITKDSLLFHQLVLSFHTAAWQQMGKVANPFTGKIEKDLEAASYSIDMLDMVKTRMQGNLNGQEERFLTRTLNDLKLNYVDELNRAKAEKTEETATGAAEKQMESSNENYNPKVAE